MTGIPSRAESLPVDSGAAGAAASAADRAAAAGRRHPLADPDGFEDIITSLGRAPSTKPRADDDAVATAAAESHRDASGQRPRPDGRPPYTGARLAVPTLFDRGPHGLDSAPGGAAAASNTADIPTHGMVIGDGFGTGDVSVGPGARFSDSAKPGARPDPTALSNKASATDVFGELATPTAAALDCAVHDRAAPRRPSSDPTVTDLGWSDRTETTPPGADPLALSTLPLSGDGGAMPLADTPVLDRTLPSDSTTLATAGAAPGTKALPASPGPVLEPPAETMPDQESAAMPNLPSADVPDIDLPADPQPRTTAPMAAATAAPAAAFGAEAAGPGPANRIPVRVRDMRTHFAPVAAFPAAIPRETPGARPASATGPIARPVLSAVPEPAQSTAPTDADLAAALESASSGPGPGAAEPKALDGNAASRPAPLSSPGMNGGPAADMPADVDQRPVRRDGGSELQPPRSADRDAADRAPLRQADRPERDAGITNRSLDRELQPAAAIDAASPPAPGGPAPTESGFRALAHEIGRAGRTIDSGAQPSATSSNTSGAAYALRRDVELEFASPDIGVVKVRMRLTGASLELRLRADDPATHSLLTERRSELEEAISDAGIDATVVEVARGPSSPRELWPMDAPRPPPSPGGGAESDGRRFQPSPSHDRDGRRSPNDQPTDGQDSDETQPSRNGPRPGTLFV